jgi:RNA polymerase sigma factor (sigma-70 family)
MTELRNRVDLAERIAECYGDLIHGTCRRMLGRDADADDVAQEVLLKVMRKPVDGIDNLAGWIHTVAVNASREWMRSQARERQRRVLGAAQQEANQRHASPDELLEHLDEALCALPVEQAELLRRHFLLGEDQRSIAADQGISQPAVSKHLDRALQALQRQLKRSGLAVVLVMLTSGLQRAGAHEVGPVLAERFRSLALVEGVRVAPQVVGGLAAWLTAAALAVGGLGLSVVSSAGPIPAVPPVEAESMQELPAP